MTLKLFWKCTSKNSTSFQWNKFRCDISSQTRMCLIRGTRYILLCSGTVGLIGRASTKMWWRRGTTSGLPLARQMASLHHILRVLSYPLNFLTVLYFQPNMMEVFVKIVNYLQVNKNIQVGKIKLWVCQTEKMAAWPQITGYCQVSGYQVHML